MNPESSTSAVWSADDLKFQIQEIDIRDWTEEGLQKLMEDHLRLQGLLRDADEALLLAGVKLGAGNVRDRIHSALNL